MGIFKRLKDRAGGQFFDDLGEHLDSEEERLKEWLENPAKREQAAREVRNNVQNMEELVTQDMTGKEAYEELMDKLAHMFVEVSDIIERGEYGENDVDRLKGHVEYMYGNARDVLESDYGGGSQS